MGSGLNLDLTMDIEKCSKKDDEMTTILTEQQESALAHLTAFMQKYTAQDNMGTRLPTLTYVKEFKEVPIPMSEIDDWNLEESWVEYDGWVSRRFIYESEDVDPESFVGELLEDPKDKLHDVFMEEFGREFVEGMTISKEDAMRLLQVAVDRNIYDGMLNSVASVHVPILTNPHLTTAACQQFIQCNKHNLKGNQHGELSIFLDYAYRNHELEDLLKAIASLTGIPLECTYKK